MMNERLTLMVNGMTLHSPSSVSRRTVPGRLVIPPWIIAMKFSSLLTPEWYIPRSGLPPSLGETSPLVKLLISTSAMSFLQTVVVAL
jgi:hypothetical protein